MELHALGACLSAASIMLTACLPVPPPFIEDWGWEDEDPWVEEDDICESSVTEVAPGNFQLERALSGWSYPLDGDAFASANVDVTLNAWASEHLSGMTIDLTVFAGQAIAGHTLKAICGDKLLAEAAFGGELGSEARIEASWPLQPLDVPCSVFLFVEGAPAAVPVPLRVTGVLAVQVNEPRGELPCREWEARAGVSGAR